jgi:hypothetical protein
MIQDGEPHRCIGETFSWFALELEVDEPLAQSNGKEVSAVPIGDYRYQVTAQVKYVGDRSVIVDFGLTAATSRDNLPKRCQVGSFVDGVIGLDLPLCLDLMLEEELPSLRYEWRVNRITADLTPHISHPDNPRYCFRDASRISFSDVTVTSEMQAPDYILHCANVCSRA